MSETLPIRFKKIEEIEVREAFDPECIISTDNFKDLLGYYKNLPKEVKCQVLRVQKPCNRKHKEGFLGLRSDGREALIGIDCGDQYFEGEEFKKKKGYVISEISITENLEKLTQLLSDGEYEKSLNNERTRLRLLKEKVTKLEEKLGAKLLHVLKNMSKTKNNAVIIQYKQIDEDDNGKPIEKWFDDRIGALQGAMLFNHTSSFGPTFGDITKIKDTIPKIVLTRDSGKIRLKKWVMVLETKTHIKMRIDSLEEQYQLFMQHENLMLLTLLVNGLKDKVPPAQLALEQTGGNSPSYGAAKKLTLKFNSQICKSLNVTEIRIK